MKPYPEGSLPFARFMEDIGQTVGELVRKVKTTGADGKTVEGVRVFLQELPDLPLNAKPSDLPFPYALIRMYGATTNEQEDIYFWRAETEIQFGIKYADPDNQGHVPMLDMLQTVADRFSWNRLVADKYTAHQDMRIELQESDVMLPPYYFGALYVNFWIPKNEKEGKYC